MSKKKNHDSGAAVQALRQQPAPLTIWGRELVDEQSLKQINQAAQLPVTQRVALMPDAHVGYGLPIGGVAALEGAIGPYMVGVDIGCRLHATIYDLDPAELHQDKYSYINFILDHTYFGRKAPNRHERNQHPILDDPRWGLLPEKLKHLKDKAAEQLGTSGGGNHFVEWTKLVVSENNPLAIPAGKYIALVSHSGSRRVGYEIANYFSKVAESICTFLPRELRRLSYLDHQSEAGEQYEIAMNLAGDYARANHEVIHRRIRHDVGTDLVVVELENHHNFAWRIDRINQPPVFVHRKGATPAEHGVTGIIPGSMASTGFFVVGQCYTAERVLEHPALNSAAHGSGRVMGRGAAIRSLDAQAIRRKLRDKNVTVIGGGVDEAPEVYKDSRQVIEAQEDLIDVWATFDPVIVRMEKPRKGKTLGQ